MHKCHCYLSNLWCKWAARIFFFPWVLAHTAFSIQCAVCSSHLKKMKTTTTKTRKYESKKNLQARKKRVLSTTNTNSLAVLAVLTVMFILGLFSFRVVLVACFSRSLCYAYPSASSSFSFQFICRLLLFIIQSKLYAHHTTSRHNVRCNIVFIVHILRCELFLFPPIFSMLFRYM